MPPPTETSRTIKFKVEMVPHTHRTKISNQTTNSDPHSNTDGNIALAREIKLDGINIDDGLPAVLYVGLAKRNNNNQASLQKVGSEYQMHMTTDEAGFAYFVSILALQKVTIHGETVVIQFDDCSESTQTTIELIV